MAGLAVPVGIVRIVDLPEHADEEQIHFRVSYRDGPDLSASLLYKDLLPLNYLTHRSRNDLPLLLIATMVDRAPFDSLFGV